MRQNVWSAELGSGQERCSQRFNRWFIQFGKRCFQAEWRFQRKWNSRCYNRIHILVDQAYSELFLIVAGAGGNKWRSRPRGRLLRFWAHWDLNSGPKDYESSALTAELQARVFMTQSNLADLGDCCKVTDNNMVLCFKLRNITIYPNETWRS